MLNRGGSGHAPLTALKKIKFEKENLMAKDLTQHTWHGVPRKEIPWFPTVDYDACIGCDLCYLTCGRDVFERDDVNRIQKVEGGGRLDFSTSILQAICVDSVILPFLSGKINMSFGCYGCRDGRDALPSEGSLGFPGNKLQLVVENLEYLARQAIGRSRSKKVYNAYINRPKKEQANIQK